MKPWRPNHGHLTAAPLPGVAPWHIESRLTQLLQALWMNVSVNVSRRYLSSVLYFMICLIRCQLQLFVVTAWILTLWSTFLNTKILCFYLQGVFRVFLTILRINSDYLSELNQLVLIYNRVDMCFLWGRKWIVECYLEEFQASKTWTVYSIITVL